MTETASVPKAVPEPDERSQPFFSGANDGVLTYDGVHPNQTGNNLLANMIAEGIYRAAKG